MLENGQPCVWTLDLLKPGTSPSESLLYCRPDVGPRPDFWIVPWLCKLKQCKFKSQNCILPFKHCLGIGVWLSMRRNSLLGNAALLAPGTRAPEHRGDDAHKLCVPEMALSLAVVRPYLPIMTEITQLILCSCHSTWHLLPWGLLCATVRERRVRLDAIRALCQPFFSSNQWFGL